MADREEIIDACISRDAAEMQCLLEADPEVAWQPDEDGRLPLHLAAEHGCEAVVRLLLEAAPAAATALTKEGSSPMELALLTGRAAAPRALLGAGPAAAVLAALIDARYVRGRLVRYLYPEFLLTPGRLPLGPADWALIPTTPCSGMQRVLPAALACSPDQAAQVVRRFWPETKACLRTGALCLARVGLLGAMAALILARSV